jgi:hypothetical protein
VCARELLRTTVGTAKEDLIATSKIKLVRTRWGSSPKREAKLWRPPSYEMKSDWGGNLLQSNMNIRNNVVVYQLVP